MSPYTKSQSVSPAPKSKSKSHGHRYSSYSRSVTPPARRPPSPPPPLPSGRGRSSSSRSTRSSSPQGSRYRHGSQHGRRSQRPIVESRCIGVFGLNVHTTQAKIREIFSKFGPIERIQVVIDAQTKRSRGFCFIYYEDLADAKAAKHECCGLEVDGRRIRVDYSITKRPHTPTPGMYKGRHTTRYRDHNERHRDNGHYSRSRQPRTPPSPPPLYSHTSSHRHSRRSRSRSSPNHERKNRRRYRDEYRSRSCSRSRSHTPRKRSRY